MIDTHSHIDMLQNPEAEIKAAIEAGVEKIIIPGVEPDTFDKITEFIDKYDNVFGCIGVHPSEAQKFTDDTAKRIALLAHHPKMVGIGEIGLDYYWDKTFVDIQKKVFKTQIEIAMSMDLPVVIHDREAHLDTFNILKEANYNKVLMHCFSGSVEFARECIKEGWYLALGGVVTFKNAIKMKEVAVDIPLDRLLLETDAPYLTPVPFRGKENQPAYTKFVAEEIAKLRGISVEEVDRITTQNANEVFYERKA